ncbi:metalloproteinase inhibitor 1 [Anolis carolinensis]|uniref:Metalloproteinase inhibitor 1 n=1 Tax=Anolis carolinensis TaxID=28377 RepID=A0A803TLA5_ANOCA|nr:PREDICTED: metalloproteinase inhibitor 1 [Anolis carolinensis]|eukprot:XP_008101754.1 PREDICTED: metalloproteinase inhibitor 1 [Anolis carolinensis]
MTERRKMNLAKVSGFLSASFLLLTLLGDTTEACSCARRHPQTAFCSSDIVLRAKFVAVNKMEGNLSERRWMYHEIKTIKLYKGPEEMQDVRYVHTPPIDGACGYFHGGPLKEEYLITGRVKGGRVTISICNFIRPWAEITLAQKRGFTSEYSKGCSCSIVGRSNISGNQCYWMETYSSPEQNDFQEEHMACLPQMEKNGTCHWQSLDTKGSRSFRKRRLIQ